MLVVGCRLLAVPVAADVVADLVVGCCCCCRWCCCYRLVLLMVFVSFKFRLVVNVFVVNVFAVFCGCCSCG